MDQKIARVLAFFIMLIIYTAIITVIARILPIIFLLSLLAWLIIRKPLSDQERLASDLREFRTKTGEAAGKLVEMLLYPLSRDFWCSRQ